MNLCFIRKNVINIRKFIIKKYEVYHLQTLKFYEVWFYKVMEFIKLSWECWSVVLIKLGVKVQTLKPTFKS